MEDEKTECSADEGTGATKMYRAIYKQRASEISRRMEGIDALYERREAELKTYREQWQRHHWYPYESPMIDRKIRDRANKIRMAFRSMMIHQTKTTPAKRSLIRCNGDILALEEIVRQWARQRKVFDSFGDETPLEDWLFDVHGDYAWADNFV